MRAVKRGAVLLPLFLLLAGPAHPPEGGEGAELIARRVPLDSSAPERRTVGGVRFLEGWELSSGDPRFGGISSIAKLPDGFLALSDTGQSFRFGAVDAAKPAPLTIRALPALPQAHGPKGGQDSESMTVDPRTGRIWVGFEANNAIHRYAPGFARGEGGVQPAEMRDWPQNGGPESLARLRDGRFLVIAEERETAPGVREALLFPADPLHGGHPLRFGYRPPQGYVPTDAAELPDGRLLVLNRRFRLLEGVSAVLVAIRLDRLARDSVIAGEEIARLKPPLTVDNMEALAVERERGRTIVWLASDDNFHFVQRTLLLKFALEERR